MLWSDTTIEPPVESASVMRAIASGGTVMRFNASAGLFGIVTGSYTFPVAHAEVDAFFTNKAPGGIAYRCSFRVTEASYAIERGMDILADALGMDPVELRRKNFVRKDQFPYPSALGFTYDSGDYHHTLDVALETIGYPALLKEQAPQIVDMMVRLLPALLLLCFALMVLINVLYLARRFPDRRGDWLAVQNLREWKAPEPLVWGLIACGFALFVPGPPLLRTSALNLLLVIAACYFAQGLAVIAYFFNKNNVPRFLRGLTYVLIIFQQIFTLLVVGVGLFDLWGDFRRLGKDRLTPSQAG